MSYDIYLEDPVTKESAIVPGHCMTGGIYKAVYDPNTGTFSPAVNTEAELNITYNYSRYYDDVYEDGIRHIYGMQGADSIAVLENMIRQIEEKYKRDGAWITTKRMKTIYLDDEGKEIESIVDVITNKVTYQEEKREVEVYEGSNTDYWKSTAANAIKPLYQLLALAKLRPDCIWNGD